MAKVKRNFTKGLTAQDFLDLSSEDIRKIEKEQKDKMKQMQKTKIAKVMKKPIGKGFRGGGARVNVGKGTKGLWDLIYSND